MGQIDFDGIENTVRETLAKDILEKEFRKLLEDEMKT